MISVIDYSMGNLRSVQKAVERVGGEARIVRTPEEVRSADRLILPGVGAFADAIAHLRDRDLVEPIHDFIATGRPLLGVCLGLQLLFDVSEEDGEHEGMGVIPGRVVRFTPSDPDTKVPQMGWNRILLTKPDNPVLADLGDFAYVYFVHSYYAEPANGADIAAAADYDGPFCAAVWRDNVHATQFHPEKSQRVGLKILENFLKL